MKLLPLSVLACAAAFGTPAHAQNYPWCSQFADGAGTNCGFTSYQQCMQTAGGTGGYCEKNNMYKAPAAAAPARRSKRVHRSSKDS